MQQPRRAAHAPHGHHGPEASGIPAALALLLVAYTNTSLLGLAFLLAFLAWGSFCPPAALQRPQAAVAAKRLWAAVSGMSALALAAQLVIQAAFLLGGWRAPAGGALLSLLGFPPPDGLADALLAVVPLLLSLMASAAQVQAARDSSSRHARRLAEGLELQPLGAPQRAAQASRALLPTRALVAAAALLAAAVAQPSVLAAPYMLAAAAAVWRWSGGGGGGSGLHLLRPYTAAYLLALYLWQALSGWAVLQPVARVLGLFSLSSTAGQGWQQLLPAAAQLAAMLLLFLSLPGGSAGGEGSARPSHATVGAQPGSERAPLLQPPLPSRQVQPQPAGTSPPPRPAATPAISMQQLVFTLLLDTAEALCRQPAAVAAILCCAALAQPSALGGLMLLLALAALLARPAASALRRWSRPLTGALLAWQLSCYGASVAAAAISIPAAAQAAGLLPAAAPWPLLALLGAAAAAAGLAWSTRQQPGGGPPQQPQQPLPPHLQRLLARIGSARQPGGSSPSEPSTPVSLATAEAAVAPWLVAWHLVLQGLFYAGLAAVPAAVFAVGAASYSVLHGLYLAGLLAHLAALTLRLRPALSEALLQSGRHTFLRCYASLHLAATYAAFVGGLPGAGGALQPAELQQPLSILGLWRPSVAAGMLPLLGLLLLASLHSSVAHALRGAPQQHYSIVGGVTTWHSAGAVHLCRLAVGYAPSSIVVLGYCLVLLDCDISLLGLALLLLLAALLTTQPPRGAWDERGEGAGGVLPAVMRAEARRAGASRVRLLRSPARRWLPLLLLAAFSCLDALAQGALPAVAAAAAAGWLPALPGDLLDWLGQVAGLSPSAHGLGLALRLLRPVLLLGAVAAYRSAYCIGTLHKQLQLEALPHAAHAARRLRSQLGWKALGKRALVLHASKAVALLALAAAMQHPGAIGWLLAGGVVLLAPMLGAPAPGATRQQPLLRAGLHAAAVLSIGWLLAQYALCLPWVQDLLLRISPDALDMAAWAGLLQPTPPDPSGGGGQASMAAQLEALLRLKCLLLVAVALRLRAFRWQAKLPDEVRAAGRCGAPCPLFWPASPDYTPPPAAPSVAGQRRPGRLSLVGSLREAATLLLSRAQHATQQALRAVDWPAGEAEAAEPPAAAAAPATPRPEAAADHGAAGEQLSQWRLLRFALQDWLERAWQEWHLDMTLFVLLLAAFSAANALSLAMIAAIGGGMALPARATQAMFKWVVVPLLGLLALFQYSVLLGPPPALRGLEAMARDVKAWLGLCDVDASSLWLLFLAFGASTLLVHFDDWARCARRGRERQQQEQRAAEGAEGEGAGGLSRRGSFDGIESPPAPLLAGYANSAAAEQGPEGAGRQAGHTTLRITASGPLPGGAAGLWQPLSLQAQPRWRWSDWLRYLFYRHYLDLLLVAVVALCTLENDAIHAAYLATALFFFRSRIVLRHRRNSLFFWLPLLNYAVMVVTLECSLAHLIGLFRLDPGESLLSLGYRGALADCLLWALIRVQSHIFDSPTYDRVQRVVAEEEAEEKARLLAEVAGWKEAQAQAALQESRQRAARRRRMERLKASGPAGGRGRGLRAAAADTSVQQLYSFLGLGGGSPRPSAAAQPQPDAALTEYEKEIGAAEAEAQQAPAAGPATAAEAAAAAGAATAEEGRRIGGTLRAWLRQRLRRVDRESVVCYALFAAAFLADCSLLTLALPLSAFCYALVSIRPSKAYWQVVLVYTEALVVAQFAYLVPRRLHCAFLSPQLQHMADVLGIHGSPVRAIPLFLAYLSTLFHTYSLATRHTTAPALAPGTAAIPQAAGGQPAADLEAGTPQAGAALGPPERGGDGGPGRRRPRGASFGPDQPRYLGELLGSSVSGGLQSMGLRLLEGCYAAWEFLLRACRPAERPPHFLLVTLAAPAQGLAPPGSAARRQWSQQLHSQLQHILDGYRRTDISAALERQERQRAQMLGGEPQGAAEQQGEGSAFTFDATSSGAASGPAVSPPPQQQEQQQQQQQEQQQASGSSNPADAAAQARYPDLSRQAPLQLSFVSVQPSSSGDGGSGSDSDGIDGKDKAGGSGSGSVAALFEVVPQRSTPDNSEEWCSVPGWPLRSLNPGRTAAQTLLRYRAAGPPPQPPGEGEGGGAGASWAAPPGGDIEILGVEHYSRQPQDWYAATTAFDFAAFLLVAFAYNRVAASAGSLSDITSRQVIPTGFLVVLMALFGFLVADRVAYTLGSPLLKALLHTGEMLLWLGYALHLFWSPLTSAGAQNTLRVMLLLKCASFALGALQLRNGFPPAASFSNGMGRHSFWFMQRCNTARAVAFQVFLALPFVYELRQLLDWSCTSTTLTLMDWFKLEDINQSLYFTTWNRKLRASKRPGERQPRWLKLLQGALLFAGLLLLLWVPLLLFSSAAPTYTVPAVESHHVNASLLAVGGSPGAVAAVPLYAAGGRRQRQQFLPDGAAVPDELAGTYVPDQFQLLCTSPDADVYWEATPPAQQQLVDALLGGGQGADPSISLSLSWSVQRDLPLPSEHGGPLCTARLSVPLAPASRRQLAALLQGEAEQAQLLRAGAGGEAGASSAALYPLAWLLRGDLCSASPLQLREVLGSSGAPEWAGRWVACNASLLAPAANTGTPWLADGTSGMGSSAMEQRRRLAAAARGGSKQDSSAARWWQLGCWAVNASGAAVAPPPPEQQATAECSSGYEGPRLVAVLERVQGGIIGQTLSRYGIFGLYTVVVLSVGECSRFLRLGLSNTKARIQFEDLPTTAPIVALCQDIYLARAEGLLAAEERLYWRLIDLYRLPSVMYQLTGPNPAPTRYHG